MVMSIAICDDDGIQVKLVETYIEAMKLEDGVICSSFYEGEELLEACKRSRFDVIFLDIEMEGLNGIEIGRRIRQMDHESILVYLTGFRNYAIEAFELQSFSYLIKPISEDRFKKLLLSVVDRLKEKKAYQEKMQYLTFKIGDTIYQFAHDEIYFFEKKQRKMIVNTQRGEYAYYGTVQELEQKLNSEIFCRCHQGYIININKISQIKDNGIYFPDICRIVPISRRYKKKIFQYIEKRLFKE